MAEPYIIRISSQKGGVGKTTVAVNLGSVLSLFGYKTLIVDTDAANPTVGFHLGMNQANVGYKEVITGKSTLNEALAIHGATGLRVLPGTIGPYSFIPAERDNLKFMEMLTTTKYDFIILDTSPGFVFSEPIRFYSEALLITTPEASACTSCMRLARNYTEEKLKHNLVVNRVTNRKYEFSIEEIEDMYENKAIGILPEDNTVPTSIAEHIPAFLVNPKSGFSRAIRETARRYVSKSEILRIAPEAGKGGILGLVRKVIGIS
ncbi:MAG: AAA family ATPase [Candidatus Micrarchaeota archaeon]|nr:AAA family ATPase [Candidatus Micrarchaeota archaeon]MDE1834211.1 AAA family ATPase [Candidatus Micrarchaeota archaeon]MDE1859739.1 AAA family ATPase [Candidatus Micrarchaeota archaeon]